MALAHVSEVVSLDQQKSEAPAPDIAINPRLCIGCRACEVACEREHGFGAVHITVSLIERLKTFVPLNCRHCAKAPCVAVCPVNACKRTPEGVVIIDPMLCIGCKLCGVVCPFGIPEYEPQRKIMMKCDMCLHRLQEGKEPACVTTCPTGALTFLPKYSALADDRKAKTMLKLIEATQEMEELEKSLPPASR